MAAHSTDGSSRFEFGEFMVGPPLGSPETPEGRRVPIESRQPPASLLPTVPRYAAVVVHGVGQQTRLETLDVLAHGIARAAGAVLDGPPVARQVAVGDTWLQRLELGLRTDGGRRELHVYEAYWAPLTEGAVSLRDVIYLVFRAVSDGVRNGTAEFRRWLFGQSYQFPPQIRTVAWLLVGLAAVLSLIVVNLTIAMVAGARWALGVPSNVVGDGLYGDLSTVLNGLFVFVVAFALVLFLHRVGKARWPSGLTRLVGVLAAGVFFLAVAATIAAGVAILLLVYLHRVAGAEHTRPLLPLAFGLRTVDGFNDRVEIYVLALALALAIAFVLGLVVRVLGSLPNAFRSGEKHKALTILALALAFGLAAGLVAEALWLGLADWGFGVRSTAIDRGVVWALLVVTSLFMRRILVQYVGDVVAYVQSHTVDRFDDLRSKIREKVYASVRAVYNRRDAGGDLEYSDVVVVGHSLGSVIAYDTLNRLVNEDAFGEARDPRLTLRVRDRTCLFLTVGSPLDKTAYLFGAQRTPTPGVLALAATVQPLIQSSRYRPARWVNVHSPWDPISGPLDYYDPPRYDDDRNAPSWRVVNLPDPAATTLFVSHLEYWEGTLIYTTLLEALPWRVTHARRATDEASCPHPGMPAAHGPSGLKRI